MKYLLYRSLGELEENEELHQLVGVEVGKDIYSVADTFVKIVNYDMNCEFPRCQGTVCYAPEFEQFAQRYDYHMFAYAHFPDDTITIDYGIIELQEDEREYFWTHWNGLKWI